MGAWSFVAPRFENLLGIKANRYFATTECLFLLIFVLLTFVLFVVLQLNYVGRKVLAAPAVGIGKVHAQEVKEILSGTFPNKAN